MPRRALKIGLTVVGLAVMGAGFGAWRVLRVEDIPEELEAIDDSGEQGDIVVPGLDGAPDLSIEGLRGKTVFLAVMGAKGWEEAKDIHRALNRWALPENTEGYIVGDAAGFGMFKGKVQEIIGKFKNEMRFPLYVDFEGAVLEAYKLPKGHHGLVVLGPDGDVVLRHSGAMEDGQIAGLKTALGATDPSPGPEAPDFEIGDLGNAACKGRVCSIAFLGEPVRKDELPTGESKADTKEAFKELMKRPARRMMMTVAMMTGFEKDVGAAVVGSIEGFELEGGWTVVKEAAPAREAFGVGADETALIVVDADGRVAFNEKGIVPQWKMSQVAHLTGAKFKDRGDGHD